MTTIGISDGRPKEPRRLRELAAWYRRFAEEDGNPVIWEARLRTAAELVGRGVGATARGCVEFWVTKAGNFAKSDRKTAESQQLGAR